MPSYIVKLEGNGGPWYMEWSTIVDAPVTRGMSIDAFRAHYREEYGASGMRSLDARMARVEDSGSSSAVYESARDIVSFNRAGPDESEISYEEIVRRYCGHGGKRG